MGARVLSKINSSAWVKTRLIGARGMKRGEYLAAGEEFACTPDAIFHFYMRQARLRCILTKSACTKGECNYCMRRHNDPKVVEGAAPVPLLGVHSKVHGLIKAISPSRSLALQNMQEEN